MCVPFSVAPAPASCQTGRARASRGASEARLRVLWCLPGAQATSPGAFGTGGAPQSVTPWRVVFRGGQSAPSRVSAWTPSEGAGPKFQRPHAGREEPFPARGPRLQRPTRERRPLPPPGCLVHSPGNGGPEKSPAPASRRWCLASKARPVGCGVTASRAPPRCSALLIHPRRAPGAWLFVGQAQVDRLAFFAGAPDGASETGGGGRGGGGDWVDGESDGVGEGGARARRRGPRVPGCQARSAAAPRRSTSPRWLTSR